MIEYMIMPMLRAAYMSKQLDPGKHAVISILDPDIEDREFNTDNVLRLRFLDDQHSFTEADAAAILDWHADLDPEITEIVITHCVAGRCRSAGVVAALLVVEGRKDFEVFKRATPNMHVYRTIINLDDKRKQDVSS